MIDAGELPFSEAEFYQAFLLAGSEENAREAASHIAWLVRDTVRKNVLAAEALGSGRTDPATTTYTTWVIDKLHFALLTLVSDDLCERVNQYMRAQWESERPSLRQAALHRAGMSILAQPTPEIEAQVDRQVAEYEAEWRRSCEEARRLADEWAVRKGAEPHP